MNQVIVPSWQVPLIRRKIAKDNGVLKKLLFIVNGGLGDRVCAEPSIRFAMKSFKDVEIKIATDSPELFSHLGLETFPLDNFKGEKEVELEKYHVVSTYHNTENISFAMVTPSVMQPVEYASIASLGCLLPIEDRMIRLSGKPHPQQPVGDYILIHAGRHWETNTIPVNSWEIIIKALRELGHKVVLCGKHLNTEQGYVDTKVDVDYDFRDKTTIPELISLCHNAKIVLTNDSSVLHIAASGWAKIGFMSFAKFKDYLFHWRKNEEGVVTLGHNMKCLSKKHLMDYEPYDITRADDGRLDKLPEGFKWTEVINVFEIVDWTNKQMKGD